MPERDVTEEFAGSVAPPGSWWSHDRPLKLTGDFVELASAWAGRQFAEAAVRHPGSRLDDVSMGGSCHLSARELVAMLEGLGGRLVCWNEEELRLAGESDLEFDDTSSFYVVWDQALMGVTWSADWTSVALKSMDVGLTRSVVSSLRAVLRKRQPKRDFHMLTRSPDGGYSLSAIRSRPSPLVRGNYEPAVVSDVEHVLEELGRPDPCGRVVVVEGPPGTGKTHLVRGLVDAIDCTVILLPPALLQDFSGPGVVSAFLDFRSRSDGPMVLVLEDADQCLAPRGSDNMASINELLSLGDGILGSALDVRIVATTNARRAEIDPAVLRPGRLCRRVDVDRLTPGTLAGFFRREGLTDEQAAEGTAQLGPSRPGLTLAEAYGVVKRWKPRPAGPQERVGFSSPDAWLVAT